MINKDEGTFAEIANCNETFLNKCCIISPKIVYGVDITIPYDNIYCIYKYSGSERCMNALEFHQQYSRARNTKCVNILIVDKMNSCNYNISFEKSVKDDDIEYALYNNKLKFKPVNETCIIIDNKGAKINKNFVFANVYYYRSWYSKLFSSNKMSFVSKLAEENGYNVKYVSLDIDNKKTIKGLRNFVQKYGTELDIISLKILNGDDMSKTPIRITENLAEKTKNRKKYIKELNKNLTEQQINNICYTDKHFQQYINKQYLDMTCEEYIIWEKKIIENDIPQFVKDNKIVNKMKTIKWLEEILKIKRYHVNDIICDDIIKIKQTLFDNIDNLILLREGSMDKKRLKTITLSVLCKIDSTIKLQKYVADCYNTFVDDIINISVERKKINKKSERIYKFVYNDKPYYDNIIIIN